MRFLFCWRHGHKRSIGTPPDDGANSADDYLDEKYNLLERDAFLSAYTTVARSANNSTTSTLNK